MAGNVQKRATTAWCWANRLTEVAPRVLKQVVLLALRATSMQYHPTDKALSLLLYNKSNMAQLT